MKSVTRKEKIEYLIITVLLMILVAEGFAIRDIRVENREQQEVTVSERVYLKHNGKGYGISITATLQSLEQLNCAYEETCIAILEHIDKLVFLSDDFLLCFDKQLSKYLEFKYGNGFLSELEDMTKEEIMVCITDKAYKILQRKENLWQ